MWRVWLNKIRTYLTPADMSKETDQIKFYASATGRSFIKEDEFFRTKKVKMMITKLLNSTVYRQIKNHTPKANAS